MAKLSERQLEQLKLQSKLDTVEGSEGAARQATESTEMQIASNTRREQHKIVMESEVSDRDDPDFIEGQRKVIIVQDYDDDEDEQMYGPNEIDDLNLNDLSNDLQEMDTEDILEKKILLEKQIAEHEKRFQITKEALAKMSLDSSQQSARQQINTQDSVLSIENHLEQIVQQKEMLTKMHLNTMKENDSHLFV